MDGKGKNLRFTANVFEKRAHKIRTEYEKADSEVEKGGNDDGEEDVVDEETEHWPVTNECHKELDDVKYTHKVIALPVYKNDQFVEVQDANVTLQGALVELDFELRHYHIWKTKHDSFNGIVQQIVVLQPGTPRASTAFKRKNVREGPVHKKTMFAVQGDVEFSRANTELVRGSGGSRDGVDNDGKQTALWAGDNVREQAATSSRVTIEMCETAVEADKHTTAMTCDDKTARTEREKCEETVQNEKGKEKEKVNDGE